MLSDLMRLETYIGLTLLSLFISWLLYKKYHWSVGAMVAYLSFFDTYRMFYARDIWGKQFDLTDVMAFETTVTDARIYLFLIAAFFLLINGRRKDQHLEDGFITLALIDSIVMICKFFWYRGADPSDISKTPYFFLNNSALDCAFIACVIPFLLKQRLWPLVAPMIAICFLTKTSTGVLGVGLGVFVYYGLNAYYAKSWRLLLVFTPIPIVASGIGYLMQRDVLFNSSGRTRIWEMAWNFFQTGMLNEKVKVDINQLIGMGSGTWLIWGPTIQINEALSHGAKEGTMLTGFPTLHNEWFQILFETGIIGLILAVTVWAMALYKSRYKPAIFASLVVFGATAIIQMNLRWFIFAFFGAWLLTCAFVEKEPQCYEQY